MKGRLCLMLTFPWFIGMMCGGCAFMQKRGSDAQGMFDIGVTVSKKPHFALYAGFLNFLSIGYANNEGTLYGIGSGRPGAVPARQEAGGVILWGKERWVYEDLDPSDPDFPDPWKVGIIGLSKGPGPPKTEIANCPKLFHLGWIGITVNCKFAEIIDFLLGWATVDIMGDDEADGGEEE